MTYHTSEKKILLLDDNSFDDDCSVSTYRAWVTRNNLQHIVDMCPQHRINWTSTAYGNYDAMLFDEYDEDQSSGWIHYSMPFVHTWIEPAMPTGLDIRICGRVESGGTLTVLTRVVPHFPGSTIFDTSVDSWWEGLGTTTNTTSTELVSDIFYPDGETVGGVQKRFTPAMHQFNIQESGINKAVQVPMSRLDVIGLTTWGYYGEITQVLVREFC